MEAAAIIICQSNGGKVLMRANAHCHRKLKGGRPFGGIIPPVPPPHLFFFSSRFHLIDSPLNVALHLDVIRTVLSQKMKDLSIPGFIPFIPRQMTQPLNLSAQYLSPATMGRRGMIHITKTSGEDGAHMGENYNADE